jgi:hypothetical protein
MKSLIAGLLAGLFLALICPLHAEPSEDLKKAQDLAHQAWNPGGDPPPNDQRADLIDQAIKMAKQAPERMVHRHRRKAIELLENALDIVKAGDTDHKVSGILKDADSELREAISETL